MAVEVFKKKIDPLEMKNTNGFEMDTTGYAVDEDNQVKQYGMPSKA